MIDDCKLSKIPSCFLPWANIFRTMDYVQIVLSVKAIKHSLHIVKSISLFIWNGKNIVDQIDETCFLNLNMSTSLLSRV